jgi:rhamnosyltransferase
LAVSRCQRIVLHVYGVMHRRYANSVCDMASPTTSIVIRALNEAEHLDALFDSIERQTQQPDEVVLVDSGSTDRTVAIAESRGAQIVHIPPGDFTFGRALNWGCEAAKGDVLIFVSAHVYALDDTWLVELVGPFSDGLVGLSYGGQTGDHRSNFAEIQLLKRWFPDDGGTTDQKNPFCNNANCAVRRSLWESTPYDESLSGLEDMAFSRNIRADGHRIAYVPSARIAHVHEEVARQTFNRYRREAIAYRNIFGAQKMSMSSATGLALASITSDVRAALRARRFGAIPSAASFRVAQFAGAWAGHRDDPSESKQIVRRMYYPRG